MDTETTGLRPYHGDRPFAVIVSCGTETFYFDFSEKAEWKPNPAQMQEDLFANPNLWMFANAKFDLAMLAQLGIEPVGVIHDLQTHERILDSTLFGKVWSLDAIASRYGYQKDDGVKKWLDTNGGYTTVAVEGKKTKEKIYHFDRAPKEVIVPYACTDGRVTHAVGVKQVLRLGALEVPDVPSLKPLVQNERELTRVVYEMERVGIMTDRLFCMEAAQYESARRHAAMAEWKRQTGREFVDSGKAFEEVFRGSCELKYTEKGNPCFDAETLPSYNHPLVPLILQIRDAKSKSDYYHGFLHHADADGVVHASFNQFVARTGRFSSSNPNLQNLTKDEDEDLKAEYVVRRAFVPRPGCFFAMLDYDQMEYRLMLDYSGAAGLIGKVKGGLDVHQATADLAGITRRQAKTANFLTIYGGGDGVLAAKLGCGLAEAQTLRAAIKAAAPENFDFIDRCISVARRRGYVYNWFGRRLHFAENECYKAPNGVIQGGCADVFKVATVRVAERLRGLKTRIVLMVHDELVLEVALGEEWVLPEIREIMQNVYRWNYLQLTVGGDHSFKSLADKVEGLAA